MNVKKFAAGMTAMLCCAGVLSYLPPMPAKTYATELVSNDFEANYEGWYGNADAVKLTAKYGVGVDGSRGMLVTGRTSLSDGASSSCPAYKVPYYRQGHHRLHKARLDNRYSSWR